MEYVIPLSVLLAGVALFAAAAVYACVQCIRNHGPWWMSLYFLAAVVVSCVLFNWLLIHAVAPAMGGFAQNGKMVGDEYFLGNHGRYVAVSRQQYEFMWAYKEWSDRALGLAATLFLLASVAMERVCRDWLRRRREAQ